MARTYSKAALPQRTGQRELFIDIETRSRQDLKKVTPYRYVEDPGFGILMAAYAVDDDPVKVVFGADIHRIPGLYDATVRKVAHNAQFERICFSAYQGLPVGRYLHPEQWYDTMAVAAELGYPQGLGALAVALGAEEKDEAGTHLINWFCKPDRDGNFRRPEDHPEKWADFVAYGAQDVETLRDVHRRLGGWPNETERAVYMADQRINDRGMAIDLELAHAATAAVGENNVADIDEMRRITGLANPNSIQQLNGWLAQRADEEQQGEAVGHPQSVPFDAPPNLRAETIEALLSRPLPGDVAQVLTLRQNIALAASKKFPAALVAANSDGRLRGGFRFFGAHTGRWTGRGVQPHNLTRFQFSKPDPATGKPVHDADAEAAAIADLKLGFGADAQALKRLVRPMFTGPLTVVDYAAIEARVIAWLAGEDWALKAFAEGRDIYVETAERMSTPTRRYSRSDGKVAVLALGFQGAVDSMRAMGADGTDQELAAIVSQWRAANAAITAMWAAMETTFRTGGPVGDHLTIHRDGDTRAIELPSGRAITYHGVKHRWTTTKFGKRKLTAFFSDPSKGGHQVPTYGGKLTENVTQGVARDVLAEALARLDCTPLKVVGHVHDEILVAGGSVEEVTKYMTRAPAWADGLPIAAAGFQCERYRKD